VEDDNLCMMEGVQYKDVDTRLIYWTCRLRIIDQRAENETTNYGYGTARLREFKKIRRNIKENIKKERKIIINNIKTSQEEREHDYCLMLKNDTDSKSAEKYDYFECREKVETIRKERKTIETLNNKDMFDKLMAKKRGKEDKKNKKSQKQEKVIPDSIDVNCIKFVNDEKKLQECKDRYKNINKCIDDIVLEIERRNIDDKVFCMKDSINKYPDSLAKFSDGNGNQNTATPPIIGPRMNRIDLFNLREKEYDKCYKLRYAKMLTYKDYLEYKCKEDIKIVDDEVKDVKNDIKNTTDKKDKK